MKILVTGAAGYIGSVLTEQLIEQGQEVIALDNLIYGHRAAVHPAAVFIQEDIGHATVLNDIFSRHNIEAVIHLAAESVIEFSATSPERFFRTNVAYSLNLLDAMVAYKVRKLVFSSTAAVYGEPKRTPIEESDPTNPINSYGESKVMFERILNWYGHAYGLRSISLRYFNAAGASERFGEDHDPETHLIPNVLKVALGQRDQVQIFGVDYNTRDGSCIRDYVHVLDIGKAHILALNYLEGDVVHKAYNLGNGKGYSVIEVIEKAREITGCQIPTKVYPRRTGDPAQLVASSELARSELGWQPMYPSLEDIVVSAWRWHKNKPQGYQT
jgi:UDP-glucose 4-epimerase